jgi:hypothetical protein
MERGDLIEQVCRNNRDAVDALVNALESGSTGAHDAPRRARGWTRTQECEHVAMAYDAFVRAVAGHALTPVGSVRRRRARRLLAWPLIRLFRRMPRGVAAPVELVPAAEARPKAVDEVRERLSRSLGDFEVSLRASAAGQRVEHPYFGSMSALDAARLCAIHTWHHARRIGGSAG